MLLAFSLVTIGCNSGDGGGGGSSGGGNNTGSLGANCPTLNAAFAVTVTNKLICFGLATANTPAASVAITGLAVGEKIMAIDFRPANGVLYGISNIGQLYVINTTNASALALGAPVAYAGATAFSLDFNPVVDRLRVTTDNGLNIRLNPTTGAVAGSDTNLAYEAGDPHFGQAPAIVGSAYLQNYAGTLNTAFFAIDHNTNDLVYMASPNNGQLETVGSLGFNTDVHTSLDVFTDTWGIDYPYAVLTANAALVSKLVAVDLITGATGFVADIGGGEVVRAFAIRPF